MKNSNLKSLSGVSMMIFPIMLLIGFVLHPDLLSLEITKTAQDLIDKFNNQPMYHIGHIIVFFAVPFIMFTLFFFMTQDYSTGNRYIFVGGIIGLIGCVILAGDKGALCIVLSAFDTLSDSEINQITPAFAAIVQRKGLLFIFYLLPLLPVGASIQLIGLIKSNQIKKSLGVLGIIGLLSLNNPDIEIISSIGAILICMAFIPMGKNILQGKRKGI